MRNTPLLQSKNALFTTECWAIVNYKDWPLLDLGWVKEQWHQRLTKRIRESFFH